MKNQLMSDNIFCNNNDPKSKFISPKLKLMNLSSTGNNNI